MYAYFISCSEKKLFSISPPTPYKSQENKWTASHSFEIILRQTWSQIHLYLKVFIYFFSKYLYKNVVFMNEKYLYLNIYLRYLTFSNTFSNTLLVSTFLFQDHLQCLPNWLRSLQLHPSANYWWSHLTAGVPIAWTSWKFLIGHTYTKAVHPSWTSSRWRWNS